MKEVVRSGLGAVGLLVMVSGVAAGQSRIFGMGYKDIGPTIGLGGIGSTVSLGGRFETAIKQLPNLGDGALGIQVSVQYYHNSFGAGVGKYSFSYIPIGATLNYHIKVNDGKIDPFVGAGLGYSIVSVSGNFGGSSGSGIYFIGRGGIRYFLKDAFALYADVGAGAATFNAGLMFRLGKAR